LETKRLVIRRFDPDDVDDYYSFASDPQVTKYLRWGPHQSKEFTRDYMSEVLHAYENGSDTPWGIQLKGANRIIGAVHVMDFDNLHRKANIGVLIAKAFWRIGYAEEALKAVFGYCFSDYSVNRMEAFCVLENLKAIGLAESLGMKCEGVLRQYLFQKGEFRDFKLFSLLAGEWTTM